MPAIRRTIKQISYAFIALSLVALLIFLFILSNFDILRQTVVPSPPVRESIVIESIDAITHDGAVDIVARIRNPNPRAGTPNYTVNFILLDSADNVIETISEKTYLLPGSLKYVSVLDIPIGTELAKVRVNQVADPVFVESQRIPPPTFNSFLRGRSTKTIGDRQTEVQKGIVTNSSNLGYRQVDIIGVAFDSQEKVVGVGKTFIGALQPGEPREFTLQWPKPPTDTVKVIVLPDTNIYQADNVLPVSGDAGRLREQPVQEEKVD